MNIRRSPTIIRGFSDPADVLAGMEGLDAALERERVWYKDAPRFKDIHDILAAVATGSLVKVESDDNVRLIRRMRNPKLFATYPSLLTPNAADALRRTGVVWRKAANILDIPPEVKLSVTSLVRSADYQQTLVDAGKLAVLDSTHVTGNAFDIDLGGYFVDELEPDREATVSLRETKAQEAIAEAFKNDLGLNRSDPIRLGPEYYREEVTGVLLYVAASLHTQGRINAVIEMQDTPNAVLHVAPAPSEVLHAA